MLLDRLIKFAKENNPLDGVIVVKTEYIPSNLSSSNIFDSSCQQCIDDRITLNNVADI